MRVVGYAPTACGSSCPAPASASASSRTGGTTAAATCIASTRAALDYLQYMHDEFFDDWLLAIAAYNCGEFRVQREVNANRARRQAGRFLQPAVCPRKRAPTCRS